MENRLLIHLRSLWHSFRRLRWRRIILVTFVIWLAISTGLAIAVHTYGYQDHIRDADVIVVLGAGLRRDSQPTASLRNRSNRGAELWHEGHAPYIICTGGFPGYAVRSEAEVCAELLIERGVPAERIIQEDRSRSTEENALYTREIMQERGWQTAVVVSDRYHLLRANYLFNATGIQTYTSPVSVANLPVPQYGLYLGREVIALEWQAFTDFFNLPFTYVPLV